MMATLTGHIYNLLMFPAEAQVTEMNETAYFPARMWEDHSHHLQ